MASAITVLVMETDCLLRCVVEGGVLESFAATGGMEYHAVVKGVADGAAVLPGQFIFKPIRHLYKMMLLALDCCHF